MARFGAIPFSPYRIVQGTHLNSPPLHHPLTASRYRRSTATDLDRPTRTRVGSISRSIANR
ncbi:Molybdopterin biosynthesis protein MoeB [Geitlerinema sp. FC II]|nr:Molybdopterin biosynthesis protein MoeB [Geitlerinema sp. FC II]